MRLQRLKEGLLTHTHTLTDKILMNLEEIPKNSHRFHNTTLDRHCYRCFEQMFISDPHFSYFTEKAIANVSSKKFPRILSKEYIKNL